MRTTLADIKASRIPDAIGACPGDPRLLGLLNEAQQRLLFTGLWWGTVQRWQFCALDGCITLPRTVASIQSVAVCGRPIPVRDFWYEFLENGLGTMQAQSNSSDTTGSGNCCGTGGGCGVPGAILRGTFPTFADIIVGTNPKSLRLACDLATDVDRQILVLGYDANLNWIRTEQNGVIRDGEIIALAQGLGSQSLLNWSQVTDIQPSAELDGQWFLYEYDTVQDSQRLIGQYQYDELRPSFVRYLFPQILPSGTGTCSRTLVEAMVKLDFVPVKRDSDYLVIGNIPALKEMMQGLADSEDEADNQRANDIVLKATALAMKILDQELDHHLGSGRRMGLNIVGPMLDGTVVEAVY